MFKRNFFVLSLALLSFMGVFVAEGVKVEASSLPPWPVIYSGSITVDGVAPGDGAQLTAKIGDTYTSVPVTVAGGRYVGLAVGGPDSSYINRVISFHLDGVVTANETDIFLFYQQPELKSPFDLTFAAYPTPTPLPTATPTNTPVASPTPEVPSPMLFSGVVQLEAGDALGFDPLIFEGKDVVARVGSFFSDPVQLEANYGILVFEGLSLNPLDRKFVGESISFLVDGLGAAISESIGFTSGGSVDLVLTVQVPEPEPVAVPTQGPTLAQPTNTPTMPPTAVPPTAVPPTAVPPTAVPPTTVPTAPAPVVVVVTATPESVEEVLVEEEEAGGSCNMPGKVSGATGAANALMLFSPLLFLAGYRGFKGRNPRR